MNTRLRYGILATVLGVLGVTLSVLGFLAARSPLAARLATSSGGVAALLTGLAFTTCAVAIVFHYGRRSAQLAAAYHELHRVTLQRERSEAALRESERFTRATLDAMHARIAVLDADGVIMAVNRAWRAHDHPLVGDAGMCDVGSHYLALCEGISDARAADAQCVADAIREILSGARPDCIVESELPPANERLVTRITRFAGHGPLRLVVAHQVVAAVEYAVPDVAGTRRAEEALAHEVAERTRTDEALAREVAERTRIEEALVRDVAERMRMEEELRASEERVQGLVESNAELAGSKAELAQRVEDRTRERDRFFTIALDMLCIADRTHFMMVNPAFTDVLGYTAEELTSRPYLDFVHPDDHAATSRETDGSTTGEPVRQFENRYRHRDGTWRWLSWTAVTERPDRVYACARDVTALHVAEDERRRTAAELRELSIERNHAAEQMEALHQALASRAREIERTNQQLEHANRTLEQANQKLEQATHEVETANEERDKANRDLESFSHSVSHDLRAPLRAIDGFARILHDENGDQLDAGGQRHLGVIRENATRMAQQIDALLDLSRFGRGQLERSQVDMTALARTVSDEISQVHQERDVVVVVEGLAPAVGDVAMLRQLFANLIDNAFKYTSKVAHPCVDVGSVDADGKPVYYVRDNGAGFDMRYADKLFHVFERLHSPHEFDGTGIGLAVVQRIVDRHGGRVWAEGRVGDGATFFFTLGRED